jgi:hypothetical protein
MSIQIPIYFIGRRINKNCFWIIDSNRFQQFKVEKILAWKSLYGLIIEVVTAV